MNANVTNAHRAAAADPPAAALDALPAAVEARPPLDALPGLDELFAVGQVRDRGGETRETARYEALALGAMAGASLPAVWLAAGRPTAWVAVATLAAAAGTALVPRLSRATFGRGSAALVAAALLAVSAPELAPMAALWTVTVVAVCTTRLPGDTGWLLTAAGGGMLAMLETVLSLMAEPLGVTGGPSGLLLAGAAGTIVAGTVGSAVGHRLALGGTGWTVDVGDLTEDDAHRSDAGSAADPDTRSTGQPGPSTDPVTGMATRGVLLRGITKAIARADVIGGRVALFVIDVDRLDTIAQRVGDRRANDVLKQVARRLRAAMPAEDVVARVGPTTFAVLVEGVGPDGCEPMVHRMAALLEEPALVGALPVSTTCSIGTAITDADLDNPERLLRAANAALHAAQSSGRGRWVHHDPATAALAAARDGLEADLHEAVASGAVDVAVQPVVDLAEDASADRTGGVEVLARWTRPDGTAVPPRHFVAVAEQLGIGARLGEIILDRALDLMVTWRSGTGDDAGPDGGDGGEGGDGAAAESGDGRPDPSTPVPRFVAVNVSRSQLEDPSFAASVAARLADRGLDPACLSVEVSAASFVDTEQARRTLGMLRSLGVGVTVDDFGRGGLGLLALRQLPVDTVKVDRQVTMDLGRDDTMAATVLSLCRAMGRRCVADGVESTAQLEAARRLGMDGAQGFLLGRPVPPSDRSPRHLG